MRATAFSPRSYYRVLAQPSCAADHPAWALDVPTDHHHGARVDLTDRELIIIRDDLTALSHSTRRAMAGCGLHPIEQDRAGRAARKDAAVLSMSLDLPLGDRIETLFARIGGGSRAVS